MVPYLELSNESSVIVSMKGRHKVSKPLPADWVVLNPGCTGMVLILSVDYQLGASLHIAHPVADNKSINAGMLQLCRHKYQ